MVEFVDCLTQADKWDKIIESFPQKDIYYTSAYARLSILESRNKAYLLYAVQANFRMCMPIIVADISLSEPFMDKLIPQTYFDAETPYGYGGPLCDGDENGKAVQSVFFEIREELARQRIVSVFIRFHPLLKNHEKCLDLYDSIRYMHHTIFINTESSETIFNNLDSKNRNMIRKAKNNKISIQFDMGIKGLDEFRNIYRKTMDEHHAEIKYYFSDMYFNQMKELLRENVFLVNAYLEKKIISSAIFFLYKPYLHYHLAGTHPSYRNLAASNLLLYEVSQWASQNGVRWFHLGGGIEEGDSLFGFKKKFNKNGYVDFWIGRIIADKKAYEFLLEMRKNNSITFDENNSFMIQYRR